MIAPDSESRQILIVEDNDEVRTIMHDVVHKLGYTSLEARTVNRAFRLLKTEPIDLMLLDIYLQGNNGLDLLKGLQRSKTTIPTVVVSGYISDNLAHQLISLGVNGMVSKPFTLKRLATEIQKVTTPEEIQVSNAVQIEPLRQQEDDERRIDTRIPTNLPVRVRTRTGKRFYMKLVDISITGMQTHSKNLDIIKLSPDKKGFAFEIPVIARLAWVKSNADGTFGIGWEFDEVIWPKAVKTQTTDLFEDDQLFDDDGTQMARDAGISFEKRQRTRIPFSIPIRAKTGKGEYYDMTLVDISSTGMQTCSDDLSVLNKNATSTKQQFAFEIPITADLMWVNATTRGTYTIGWRFEHDLAT